MNNDELVETPEPEDLMVPATEPVTEAVAEPELPKEKPAVNRIKQNVTQSEPTFVPLEEDYTGEVVDLPVDFEDTAKEALLNLPNMKLDDNKNTRDWAETLTHGLELGTYNAVYKKTLEEPGAHFEQSVQATAGKLQAGSPKFKASENETFKGERAVFRIRSHIGLGALFRVPLWNSGFWITFKAPSEGDMLELHRQIINDKITLGRSTYGLAFSNVSSYMVDKLLTFAFANLYQTNLKSDIENVRDLISAHDIPSIIWAIACTVWPNGFKYNRACACDPEKCQHVVSEKLNLTKLQWTNTAGLTKWQINHMVNNQPNSVDKESVLRYQKEILQAQQRQIWLAKGTDQEISVILKVPSATEYIEAGNRWVSNIVDNVTRALGMNANPEQRDDFILNNGRTTAMRQYIHWVSSIGFGTNTVEDKETLESVFDALSSEDKIRGDFMTGVEKYINDTALTVIGIPSYDCPKCGKTQETNLPRHTNVIPIDVYQTFFILLVQRLQRIRIR